jgi:hypothetical protein
MTKKIVAGFLGLAMTLAMFPGVAQGVTAEELLAQIQELQDQLNALMAQYQTLTGAPAGVPAACAGMTSFTRDLAQGMSGDDVKCLQALLNTDAATQLGTSGAGSPGSETTYFGPLTHAAVVKFQNLHAAEILTPIGLTAGTGYVGPATRPVLDAMLVGGVVVECDEDADCLAGYVCVLNECVPEAVDGEAAEGILTAEINPVPASGAKVYEGNTDVSVMGLKLKAKLSDIDVQRITFYFGSHRMYDFLTHLSIYDGDTLVADTALNSSTVYKSGGYYYLQVTNFSVTVPKDDTKVLTVKVNAPSAYPSWLTLGNKTIALHTNGVRGVDTAGIVQYAGTQAVTRTFSVNTTLAASATLTVSRNAASPLPFNIGSGSLGVVYGVEVLTFDVKAEYDDVKITDINSVAVAMGGSGGATSGVAYLYDGDTVLNSAAITGGTGNFADMELWVPQDTTKTLVVKADYSSVTTTLTTSTVTVSSGANIVAENSAGMTLGTSAKTGSAASYPVYLYTAAPTLALVGTPTITKTPASEVASATADAVIKFTMKAEGGNVTVTSTGAVTAGYTTTTYADATTTGLAVTYEVSGAGTPSGGVYTIAKDTTATITVNVNVSAATLPAAYKSAYGYVTLTNVSWNGTQDTSWVVDIYKTGKVILP